MADEFKPPPIGSFGTFDKPLNMPTLEWPEFTPGQFDAPPPKVDPVDNLYRQITGQVKNLGTSKQWQGGALGELTFDGTARYMASILAERGITSIDQIGQKTETITRPIRGVFTRGYTGPREETLTRQVLINKNTGQPLVPPSNTGHEFADSYAKSDGSYTWSGTYAGSGNTAFNLTFDEQGLPIFYTRGHSSSTFIPQDLGMIVAIGSLAFPGIGTAIGNLVAGSVGLTVSAPVAAAIGSGILNTAITGDVKKGVLSAAGSYVGAQVAEGLGSAAADIFESTAGQNFVKNLGAAGARAAVMGEDVGKAIQTAATGGMFNLVATQIPGFSDIKDKNLKALVSDSINTALNTEGDLSERLQRATLQGAISYGAGQVEVDGKKFADLTPGQKTLVTDLLSAQLSGKPLDQALINSAIKVANSEITQAVRNESKTQPSGLYEEPVLADEFGVSGREDGQLFASDIFPEETLTQSRDFTPDELRDLGLGFSNLPGQSGELGLADLSGLESVFGPTRPAAPPEGGETVTLEDGSSFTLGPSGDIVSITDSEGVNIPIAPGPSEADQIFDAAEELRRAYDAELERQANEQTIDLEDGSSVTLDKQGNVVEIVDPDGQVTDLRPDTVESGADTIEGGEDTATDVIEGGEDTVASGADLDTIEGGADTAGTGLDILEGGETTVEGGADTFAGEEDIADSGGDTVEGGEVVEDESDRIAREVKEELAKAQAALEVQPEPEEVVTVDRAEEASRLGFPDVETYDLYGGDIAAYTEQVARDLGFPNVQTYEYWGGNIDAYRQDEAEYAGFPDWDTYTKYSGDSTAYQNDLAVAEGWPDAATKEEYGTFERYAQHLKDEADLEARGQAWENEQTAYRAGFPNYATYTQFGGDVNAYTAAQNELMAKGAEFPDYKTYMEYGGDLNAYEQDLLEQDAILAGFPDHATQVQYGGSYEAYQADLQEQDRIEKEGIATAAGFPDYATYQEYEGDDEAYQAKLEEDRLAEAARVAKAEEDARIAQDALNEELAQSNGFPDYATYLEFDGDQDAYLASLAPPVVEPEEPTEPVVEPPYTPGEDAEEFEPPVEPPAEEPVEVTETPYTPGEDAEEFQPPYTPAEDAEEFLPLDEVLEPSDMLEEEPEEITEPVSYTPEELIESPEDELRALEDDLLESGDEEELDEETLLDIINNDTVVGGMWGDEPEDTVVGGMWGDEDTVVGGMWGDEEEGEEDIDPSTGLPRIKIQPPKQTVPPPKKPITAPPPGITPDQITQFINLLGYQPFNMGAQQFMPYELPFYFQLPEEDEEAFDITQAFSPTLYRLQKE